MHRSASRLTRVLACAAVPVILTVAGCSSDSGKGSGSGDEKKKSGSSASSSAGPDGGAKPSAAPTLEKAAFDKLPEPCKVVQAKTIETLVVSVKDKNGTATKSNDLASRGGCSWNGLDEDGLKGSDYRWLAVSLVRYDSQATLGSGNKRAEEQYAKQVEAAKAAQGAENVKAEDAGGVGDQATSIIYTTKKDGVDFFNTTVVARTQNVVISLDYNGASYEGAKAPEHAKLLEGAITAAKEAVGTIGSTNQQPQQ
ncbi:DUF3558 domain-containing protein [Streptomyces sp. NPDC048603]|uniref:DUF3558 domain-containing protein n=1 Tax=Streptomyces sp. NPDC048603 TaxID=3365577 RepID=UPI00371A789F